MNLKKLRRELFFKLRRRSKLRGLFLAKKDRSKAHSSKKVVQRFNGSFELNVLSQPLPQAALDILGVLGAEGVAAEAVRVAGVVKSDVTYWKNRFIKAGALTLRESQDPATLGKSKKDHSFSAGRPKYYNITPYGSKLLTGSDNTLRLPVVFEDHPAKFGVLRWERKKVDGFSVIDWEHLGQPRNWVKLGFRVTGVRVVRTSKSVIIHPGPLKGFDVDQLEVDSGRIVERVRYILEVKFGMQLSDECVFLHGPMWQVFHPDAREWIKAGSVKAPGFGALDASSKSWLRELSGVPHVEFEKKEHAAIAAGWPVASDSLKRNASAAPMYPLYLEEVHRMVVGLVGQVEVLTAEGGSVKNFGGQVSLVMGDLEKLSLGLVKLGNLDKIVESLQKISGILVGLVDLGGNASAEEAPKGLGSGSGGKEYVV